MTTDLQLLSRYHDHGDVLAFRDLMQAHAGMVFSTARRITQDEALAEDVAQETFFQLARQSQRVTQSVAAWLHRVAWRKACNVVRDSQVRRNYEQEAATTQEGGESEAEASWAEIEPILDAIIDELPDDLRQPLVMHFLQGRSQREIATELNLSQSTVSRTVEAALAELRQRLRSRNLLCGLGLAALLTANASSAVAPAALMTSLTKLSMTGIGSASLSAAGTPWITKAALAALVTAAGLVTSYMVSQESARPGPVAATPVLGTSPPSPAPLRASALPFAAASSVAAGGSPQIQTGLPAPVPTATTITTLGKPMPVHELVHSFPQPPKHPHGHLVQDAEGWLWGITGSGGRYGRGALFRVRPDGSDWEERVSFNGQHGLPFGSAPAGGVAMDKDGILWGATGGGGQADDGTLYRYDPRQHDFQTVAEFTGLASPVRPPVIAPDGQVWGTTSMGIYRYNPATQELATVQRFHGTAGPNSGWQCMSELIPDGRGWFWGTTSQGGAQNLGAVFKIEIATGAIQTVVEFTGRAGTTIGSSPVCGLRLRENGFLWGCTRTGGSADHGTIFKVHADTGAFISVAEFNQFRDRQTGMHPETILSPDGNGYLWGTASYGGAGQGTGGQGTIYRVNEATGEMTTVVAFTGVDGAASGGPARGHLLMDQPGSFVGLSGFGGAASSGVIFRVHAATGQYQVIKDMADLALTTEGVEPHGRLAEGSDGWLWGTTFYHGAHHCGTIYKVDPVTQKLVSVIDFTGRAGLNRGRSPDAGLVSDGRGYLWGTTRFGGSKDLGTVFKFHEATGVLTTVADLGTDLAAGPMAELVLDTHGNLWGTASNTVFKVTPQTQEVETVAVFQGDRAEPYGHDLGTLGLDAQGQIWGAALADRTLKKASVFKIDPLSHQLQTAATFADANAGWSGWHPAGHMYRDPTDMLYFTGVLERGGPRPKVTLNRLNPADGQVEILSVPPKGGSQIETPVADAHGRLWGAMVDSRNSALYSYDIATRQMTKFMDFTGAGAQAGTGAQAMFGRMMKGSDGNLYSVTRYGGPGNGGTIYRLRFGPTPMTQEAVLLADGRAELHGILRPNGRDTEAAFEWGLDPKLADAQRLPAGIVPASAASHAVVAVLGGLKPGTSYYFRLVGQNPDNAVPQRGAVLRFSLPAPAGDSPALAAAAATDHASSKNGSSSAPFLSRAYALKVVLIPGAGAGIVSGALPGNAYRIGQRHTLIARADNDYVFTHWRGPGIHGSRAENAQLDFTFTEELARAPVITATFVKNPFLPERIGHFRSLVRAVEDQTPSVENTGVVDLQITRLGTFTGRLRYQGDDISFTGTVDTGGSARFGTDRSFTWTCPRGDKPPLVLCFQMDLSSTEHPEIRGFVGVTRENETVWQSVFNAERSLTGELPGALHSASLGGYELTLASDRFTTPGSGHLRLRPANSVHLVARLPDGTSVTGHAPLSQSLRPSFFEPLYLDQRGSLGARLGLPELLSESPPPQDDTWWFTPGEAAQSLVIQRRVERP